MGKPNTLGRGPHWELGNRVKLALDHAGLGALSYEKIGVKLGMSAGGVGKLLNGHNAGSYDTIRTVAIITNTNFEWLSTGRGDMVYRMGGGVFQTDGLTDEGVKAVEAVIESLRATSQKGKK